MTKTKPAGILVAGILAAVACASPPPTREARIHRLDDIDRDIFLILDVSLSTVDSWPRTPLPSDPPSFLDYEIDAARTFLSRLDRVGATVGIIAFAGAVPGSQWKNPLGTKSPAWTQTPLTTDFDMLERALTELGRKEPEGQGHLAAGIDQGLIELARFEGATSKPRLGAHPSIVVLTDDLPGLPYGPAYEKKNLDAARRALGRAGQAGIECHIVGLGPDTNRFATLESAAAATGGSVIRIPSSEQLPPAIDRLAVWLSPAAGPTVSPVDPFVALPGSWGWPSDSELGDLSCSKNPHTIAFSDDRRTLSVRYQHPVERGKGPKASESSFRVLEHRNDFIRIEKLGPVEPPAKKPSSAVLRSLPDSYCLRSSAICTERCP